MNIKFLSYNKYTKHHAEKGKGVRHIWFYSNEQEYKAAREKHGNTKNFTLVLVSETCWFIDIKEACENIKTGGTDNVYLVLKHTGKWKSAVVSNVFKRLYNFDKYVTTQKTKEQVYYMVDECTDKNKCTDMVDKVVSSNIARDLATEPANKMYPSAFCDHVRELFKSSENVKVTVMEVEEMKKKGMNLVLGIGVSAKHDPRFLVIEAKSKTKGAENVCLLGKGVVFDAGGYDLKGAAGMINMKGDKTGGAVVVGIIHYISKTQLKHNVIGIVPLVENLISHKAHKAGDVLTSYNGKTVEMMNMDAEGRLILADALAYACEVYKPRWVFDFATLTGWSSTLHCDTSFVYFTTNDEASSYLQKIGDVVGERSIRMPNWPEYIKYTKGRIADYKNYGFSCSKSGGFMAAMFLMNFVEEKYRSRWVHIDITHSHNNNGLHNCNSISTGIELVKKIAT